MSRPRREPEERASEAFCKEVRMRQGYYDLMTQQKLAECTGIPQPTLSRRLRSPEDFTVGELRKLVGTLEPDPGAVLLLVGYPRNAIQKYAK